MNVKKFYSSKNIIFIIIIIIISLCLYWLNILKIAHSSFENYYKFRGCIQLIEKNDVYGTCRISSGETIKLVKFGEKWFLDDDLPY